MSTSATAAAARGPAPGLAHANRFLPLLLLLFIGSGCAALIYEIVWYQVIQLVIGSSAISIGVLLGTFMGGMFLGSLFLPRYVALSKHPLRVYAYLEIGIGVFALVVLFGLPVIGKLYAMIGGQGPLDVLLRALLCAVFLLPPTIMMGGTLPAIARWTESTPRGVGWMGFFYAGNIAGAVVGCLLAGFYLLRVADMAVATYVAMVLNFVVAGLAIVIASRTVYTPAVVNRTERLFEVAGSRSIYIAIALSGLTALGAEVVWTRLLSLTFGASVYTFSIILAVFLLGLGIGSSAGSVLARSSPNPRLIFGWCQLLLTLAIAWAAYTIARALPYWPVNPSLTTNAFFNFQLDFVRCAWATLPGALLWGASFPLAVASASSRGQDPARLLGGVYAANTVGAILGALIFSVFAVPQFGTQNAQRLLLAIAAVSGVMLLLPRIRTTEEEYDAPTGDPNESTVVVTKSVSVGGMIGVAMAALLAVVLLVKLPKIPGVLAGYGRYSVTYAEPTVKYLGEGMNSTVMVSQLDNGILNFHVAGKIEASTEPQDMRLQRMLGHISALLHPAPKSVLIVGFGAGVTAGSFVLHPGMERIVICEIEPLIPTKIGPYFTSVNYDVVHDNRVKIVYDDARHYILTTDEKFDIITSDPIHPWVKGAATLYTKEYFELAKKHLNPGGVITQWVPLYESNTGVVKSEIATFFEVFPNGTVWSNDINGRGYDVLLAGRADSSVVDVDAMHAKLTSPAYGPVAQSLSDVGFNSAVDLMATYGGWGPDLKTWLTDAEINRDRNLRLQYLAGLGLNLYLNADIYSQMRGFRRYPDQLFKVSDPMRSELQMRLSMPPGGQ